MSTPALKARPAGLPRIAAAVGAVGFVLVAGYQVLLALGIAFSGAAWGGATLTSALRLASAVSALVLVVAALIVLGSQDPGEFVAGAKT